MIVGERFTQGIEDATLYSEKMYSINFTATKKKFCLSLHYNGGNSYLFDLIVIYLMAQKLLILKQGNI